MTAARVRRWNCKLPAERDAGRIAIPVEKNIDMIGHLWPKAIECAYSLPRKDTSGVKIVYIILIEFMVETKIVS